MTHLFVRRQTLQARLRGASVVATVLLARDDRGGGTGGQWTVVGPDGVRAISTDPSVKWVGTKTFRGCSTPERYLLDGKGALPLRLAGEVERTIQVFGLVDPMRPLTRAAVSMVVGNPIFVRGVSRVELGVGGGGQGATRLSGRGIHRIECSDK